MRWAEAYGLDPNFIAVVMQIESCGAPAARSSAGALGLFQVMPYHFGEAEDPLDPETNAARGLRYLQRSLELSGGDIRLALAGYNGGHAVISRPERVWPAETVRYADWGWGLWQDALSHAGASQTLHRWLAAGGASLCRQAAQWQALHPAFVSSMPAG